MDKQTEANAANVVSLFSRKTEEKVQTDISHDVKSEESSTSFFEAIRKNKENEERIRKERLKANQSVLKSYRIKN
jgi:hypothetical protein